MKTSSANMQLAWSRIDTLGLLFILAILAALFLFSMNAGSAHIREHQCVNNLAEVGRAFMIGEKDHGDYYPMKTSEINGGTMEFVENGGAFKHFQVLSNELRTPKVLCCPADRKIKFATNFMVDFGNANISYFVGVDAWDIYPQMFLAGDRNITNGVAVKSGLLVLTTNELAGWTGKIHDRTGNVLMADASVQLWAIPSLRLAIQYTGAATNRLAIP